MDGIDDDGCGDELYSSAGGVHLTSTSEKKRRLSNDQVRSLEKSFDVENKLDPDRKLRLAADLGLQPRQVAVWFQNRRARWKTKQLECDYSALKSSHDALLLDRDALRRTNHSLLAELSALKAKLAGEDITTTDDNNSVKVEPTSSDDSPEVPLIYKDGSPDIVDSSAVADAGGVGIEWSFQQELMKAEQGYNDEPCSSSFFADEQAPTLAWYCHPTEGLEGGLRLERGLNVS